MNKFESMWIKIIQLDARMSKPETVIKITSAELKRLMANCYEAGKEEINPFDDLFGRVGRGN